MQLHRALDRGLGVELGREADLEQDVLHHIAAERALELEFLATESDVVEAPGLDRQRARVADHLRSEEHTSELQSLMRISYAVFCLKKKNITKVDKSHQQHII